MRIGSTYAYSFMGRGKVTFTVVRFRKKKNGADVIDAYDLDGIGLTFARNSALHLESIEEPA
jgi:hypothetical protein